MAAQERRESARFVVAADRAAWQIDECTASREHANHAGCRDEIAHVERRKARHVSAKLNANLELVSAETKARAPTRDPDRCGRDDREEKRRDPSAASNRLDDDCERVERGAEHRKTLGERLRGKYIHRAIAAAYDEAAGNELFHPLNLPRRERTSSGG